MSIIYKKDRVQKAQRGMITTEASPNAVITRSGEHVLKDGYDPRQDPNNWEDTWFGFGSQEYVGDDPVFNGGLGAAEMVGAPIRIIKNASKAGKMVKFFKQKVNKADAPAHGTIRTRINPVHKTTTVTEQFNARTMRWEHVPDYVAPKHPSEGTSFNGTVSKYQGKNIDHERRNKLPFSEYWSMDYKNGGILYKK